MTNTQKTIAFWAGIVVAASLTIFLLASTDQVTNTAATTNTISFSGEGKVSAKPDVAMLSFSVVTEAATSKAAQDANSVKSNKITDFLKKQGIEDKDVKTTGYNVYPQYSYPRPVPIMMQSSDGSSSSGVTAPAPAPDYYPNPKITGYQVVQSFEVKVRIMDNVGGILDGLVAAGANQVNNLGFQIDNPEKLKDEARAKAIADAKDRASQLKRQLGIRLGKIVNFTENTGGYPYPFALEAKDMVGRGVAAPIPSIPTGENEITISVTITYQIR